MFQIQKHNRRNTLNTLNIMEITIRTKKFIAICSKKMKYSYRPIYITNIYENNFREPVPSNR